MGNKIDGTLLAVGAVGREITENRGIWRNCYRTSKCLFEIFDCEMKGLRV